MHTHVCIHVHTHTHTRTHTHTHVYINIYIYIYIEDHPNSILIAVLTAPDHFEVFNLYMVRRRDTFTVFNVQDMLCLTHTFELCNVHVCVLLDKPA